MGGPGSGPKPGSPLYVCRAYANQALYPGKWIQGECSITVDGREQKVDTYEVASGNATWQNFDGNIGALVPGGFDADGSQLYICRFHYRAFGDKGYQPGRLSAGKCLVPFAGVELTSGPPFEALYNVFSGPTANRQPESGPAQPSGPNQGAAQTHGLQVTFVNGTGAMPGAASVTNGETGKTVTKPLPANATVQQCIQVLQQAAFEAGLQIQSQADGKGIRVAGTNNAVNVTQASVSISQY